MPNYHRVWMPGATYFFTVNLLEQGGTVLVDNIDALRAAFLIARAARPFEIIAMSVLPNHLHCVWLLPAGDADNATRWRHIKTQFSRSVDGGEDRSDSRKKRGEHGIWQLRYWEHFIHDERDLRRHIDYVHFNPVKHRLVTRVVDWPWSTFHRYVRAGILPVNWYGDSEAP